MNMPSDSLLSRARLEGKHLFSLGSPILISQLLQASVIVVDTIMAGNYSSEDLSGVAIGGSIWFPVALFLFGIISALTPTVAQCHGRGDVQGVAKYVHQSMWLALAIAPCIMASILLLPALLRAIDAAPEISPIVLGYLSAMVMGMPGLLLYNVLRSYSDGLSLTKPALWASALGLAVNVPLNYALIFGKFGLPEMGGAGCGVASAIAFYVMMLFMLVVTLTQQRYRQFAVFKRLYLPAAAELRQLLHLGVPIGLANFVEASMFGVIALFLASLGTVEVAAHQIALNFSAVVFMIPFSLSIALTIRAGYLIGAGHQAHARFTAFLGLAMGLLYAACSALLLFVFRVEIALLYNKEADVVALAAVLLSYAAIFQIGDAMQVVASGALRGYKDTRTAMVIMILTFWCFAVPLGYSLGLTDFWGPAQGAIGFWKGLVLGLFAAGGLLVFRLYQVSSRALQAA